MNSGVTFGRANGFFVTQRGAALSFDLCCHFGEKLNAAERLDVLAALDVAAQHRNQGLLLLAGYSFGSMVALDVCPEAVDAWLAVAPPLGMMPTAPSSALDPRSKHLIVPEHDQYSPPEATAAKSSDWASTTMSTIAMGDHFLAGRLDTVTRCASDFIGVLASR